MVDIRFGSITTQDVDILTRKDEVTISFTTKSKIAKLLQTNSASDFDGTNSHSRKRIFNYASLALSTSPAFSNILQLLHFYCLIKFLATYPVATFALFSCRTLSTISCVLVPKMSSITVTYY